MKHIMISASFAALLVTSTAQAQSAPASTQTSQGTIIWNTPGGAPAKSSSANTTSGVPDKNGIIWNDAKPNTNESKPANNGVVTSTGPSPMTGHINGDSIIWDTPPAKTGASSAASSTPGTVNKDSIIWDTPAPTKTPRVASAPAAEQCREFTTDIVIDGQRQPAHGTVCRQPDGSWRVVNR